jgi:hypothetical protein
MPAQCPGRFFAKYAGELGPGRLDAATFRATYTQAIRIVPDPLPPVARPPRGARPEPGRARPPAVQRRPSVPASARRARPARARRDRPRAAPADRLAA